MVDNQHKKITGYRDLSEQEIQAMNAIKEFEGSLVHLLEKATIAIMAANDDKLPQNSARWLAMARTNLETGIMYAVKAIAAPEGGLGDKR